MHPAALRSYSVREPVSEMVQAGAIDDMTIRKLGTKTQAGYIRAVKNFAAFLGHAPARLQNRQGRVI